MRKIGRGRTSTTRKASEPIRPIVWIALVLGVVGGLYSGAFSFAVLNDTARPGLALRAHGELPRAAAQLGDLAVLSAGKTATDQSQQAAIGVLPPSLISGIGLSIPKTAHARVEGFAMRALRSTPLSSSSLRQLSFVENEPAKRRELLELAQDITKRDVFATLQLAELQLRDRDDSGGLASMEQSLTVSRTVDTAVFPILLGAAQVDPQFAGRLAQRLRTGPEWTERFVRWALENPASLPTLSRFLDDIPANSPARAAGYGQQIVDVLISQGSYEAAFATYSAYVPSPPNLNSFTRGVFTPIDWKLIDTYDTGARIFGNGTIEVFVSPGRQGEVAQIITRLPGGMTRLSLYASDVVGSGGTISLTVNCLDGTAVLAATETTLPLSNGPLIFPVPIPVSKCQFQRLTLSLDGASEPAGAILRGSAGATSRRSDTTK